MLKNVSRKVVILLIVCSFSLPMVFASDDWPMFRHDPQHTGYSDCEMPDELELLWKYKTDGQIGCSSPAIVDGKVYVGSGSYLYCLDANTGEKIWRYKTEGGISSPAVIDDRVYFGSYDDCLYCLDANTGELIWKYKTDDWVESSPAIVNGKVYVGSDDGYIYCFDANTGKTIWRYKTDDDIDSSPAVANGKVYVGTDPFTYEPITLYCFNADTGKLLWKKSHYVTSSAAVVDGKVYVGSGDGHIYCFDANTGKLIWKRKIEGSMESSPAVVNGKVYVGSYDDHLYCFDANTGKLIWKYKTGDSVSSSPAVASGKVYVGSGDDHLYCFNADTGELIWKYKTEGEIDSSPAIVDGKVYVGSRDGYLYCFGTKKATLSIISNPSASVYINDTYKGTTPLRLEIEEGNYEIRIEKEDYESYTEMIEVSLGEDRSISVELIKIAPPPTKTPAPTTTPPPTTTAPTTSSPTTTPSPTTTSASTTSLQRSNYLLYIGIFAAIVICVFAVYYITKKKTEKEVPIKKEPIEKKPEEKPTSQEAEFKEKIEKLSPRMNYLLKRKEELNRELEELKKHKYKLISQKIMTEETYKKRYEEIMDQLVDIEDKIIQEKMKGGKKK